MSPPASAASAQTVQRLLREARGALRVTAFKAEPREAALILGHVLGWTEAKVLAYPEIVVASGDVARFHHLLEQRLEATPVAYLLGAREFWGRAFAVDSRVLIPRPETEHLIEMVLGLDLPDSPRILEIGTGSGCLAITLALEIPESRALATDLSIASLAVARQNALAHEVEDRVRFVATDLLRGLQSDSFDLVISNPPYVARQHAPTLSPEILDHEPELALFGDDADGTGTIARLLREAMGRPYLAIEIGAGQEKAVETLACDAGWHLRKTIRDLAGITRTLLFSPI